MLDIYEANLRKFQKITVGVAEEVGYQLEALQTIRPFWENVSPTMLSGTLSSGFGVLNDLTVRSEDWVVTGQRLQTEVGLMSGTANFVANTTAWMDSEYFGGQYVDAQQVQALSEQRERRDFIQGELAKIDPDLARRYTSVWQNIYIPQPDPTTGPLFQMRELLDAMLRSLAPDEDVMAQAWFVQNEQAKRVNPNGVTRAQRVKLISEARVKNPQNQALVRGIIKHLLDIFNDLNVGHNTARPTPERTREIIEAANASLLTILQAIVG